MFSILNIAINCKSKLILGFLPVLLILHINWFSFFLIFTLLLLLISWVMFSKNFPWRVYNQFLSWKTTWLNNALCPLALYRCCSIVFHLKMLLKGLRSVWIVYLLLFLGVEVYGNRGEGMIVACFYFYLWVMYKIFFFSFWCYLTSPECILMWAVIKLSWATISIFDLDSQIFFHFKKVFFHYIFE